MPYLNLFFSRYFASLFSVRVKILGSDLWYFRSWESNGRSLCEGS
jgi:hypothetical protein